MYNNAYSTSAFTNNPFISDPTNAQSRFPDLTTPSPPNNTQYTQWLQSAQPNANPYLQPGLHSQQPLQQTSNLQPAYVVPQQPSGIPFQPSSSFGQQLAVNMGGSSYGYLQAQGQPPPPPQQQQQQQLQQQEYNTVQQQLQSPTYIAQFDPYASIGQGWDGQSQHQNLVQNPSNTGGYSTSPTSSSSTSPSGDPHPRDYIRTHKVELEAWDGYAWKQLLNAFDALKNAWDMRTKDLGSQVAQLQQQLAYSGGGYYAGQIQQEGTRLQGVRISFGLFTFLQLISFTQSLKEAQSNFGAMLSSVVAYKCLTSYTQTLLRRPHSRCAKYSKATASLEISQANDVYVKLAMLLSKVLQIGPRVYTKSRHIISPFILLLGLNGVLKLVIICLVHLLQKMGCSDG